MAVISTISKMTNIEVRLETCARIKAFLDEGYSLTYSFAKAGMCGQKIHRMTKLYKEFREVDEYAKKLRKIKGRPKWP
jgi:hypothetical protein